MATKEKQDLQERPVSKAKNYYDCISRHQLLDLPQPTLGQLGLRDIWALPAGAGEGARP